MSSVQAEHDDVDGPWLQNRPTEFRKMRRSGRSAVAMVQAAEDGRRHQATISVDLAGRGSVAVERQVRAAVVVVIDILAEDAEQMTVVQRNDVVSALAANATDDALDEGILPRRRRREFDGCSIQVSDATSIGGIADHGLWMCNFF